MRGRAAAPVEAAPGLFPQISPFRLQAWACELPATHDLPLSRWRCDDLAREVTDHLTAAVETSRNLVVAQSSAAERIIFARWT
jgi:hypothetical protein